MNGKLAWVVVAGIVLAGCAEPMTQTQKGSLIGGGTGAVVGALAGQAIGGSTKATLIGAAVGAAAGGVTGGLIGNFTGELFSKQGHLGAVLAAVHPDLNLKPFARVEGACASGGLALLSGIDAVSAGYDVVLVAGAEVQTTVNASEGADYLARAAHYATQRSIDPFTFPCLFARRAKAYRQAYKVSEQDLARVVVKAYANGNKNPNAHMREVKMTLENAATASDRNALFLENKENRDYM